MKQVARERKAISKVGKAADKSRKSKTNFINQNMYGDLDPYRVCHLYQYTEHGERLVTEL